VLSGDEDAYEFAVGVDDRAAAHAGAGGGVDCAEGSGPPTFGVVRNGDDWTDDRGAGTSTGKTDDGDSFPSVREGCVSDRRGHRRWKFDEGQIAPVGENASDFAGEDLTTVGDSDEPGVTNRVGGGEDGVLGNEDTGPRGPLTTGCHGDRDDHVVVDGCGKQCGCSGFDGAEDVCARAYPFASWVIVGEVDGG